jgi:hypothetical protein
MSDWRINGEDGPMFRAAILWALPCTRAAMAKLPLDDAQLKRRNWNQVRVPAVGIL